MKLLVCGQEREFVPVTERLWHCVVSYRSGKFDRIIIELVTTRVLGDWGVCVVLQDALPEDESVRSRTMIGFGVMGSTPQEALDKWYANACQFDDVLTHLTLSMP